MLTTSWQSFHTVIMPQLSQKEITMDNNLHKAILPQGGYTQNRTLPNYGHHSVHISQINMYVD